MVESKDSVLRIVKQLLEELQSTYDLKGLYLYGSYAENRANEDSDIDVAVILESIEYSDELRIFRLAHKKDIRIEALCFSKKDFDHSLLPIIPEIKRKGIRIL